jgi:hypothetical protein
VAPPTPCPAAGRPASKSPLAGRYHPSAHQPTDVDSSSTFTLASWSTAQLRIGPGAGGPLIEIHLDQAVHARFGGSANYVDLDITSRVFCTDSNTSECQCPPGDSGTGRLYSGFGGQPDSAPVAPGREWV